MPFFVRVAQHRHHQTVRRIHRHTDVEVLLEHQISPLASSEALNSILLQRRYGSLEQECQRGDFDVLFGIFLAQLLAERLHFADVGFVKLRDVRDAHPVAMQIRTGDFLDTRQRFDFDSAEFGEVHFRHGEDLQAAATRCTARLRNCGLDEVLHVVPGDAPLLAAAFDLRHIHAELAREAADRRAECAEILSAPLFFKGELQMLQGQVSVLPEPMLIEQCGVVTAASLPLKKGPGISASLLSSNKINESCDTLSPALTFISLITLEYGDGTSIAALSVSSVIRLSSALMVSPALTITDDLHVLEAA